MPKTLVIVESPAKARTIERFLKSGYEVLASYGHVRDLPESADEIPDEIRKKKWGRLGVDTEGDFKPYYVIPNDKRKYVQALQVGAQGRHAGAARDRPRSRRRVDQLASRRKSSSRRCRSSASSSTRSPKDAINEALKDAHDVDENLVRAQESRRILDRLYGYTLSPVLWKKVQTGLSAGRVQSVAMRLIVDREEERLAFTAATYWDLEARLSGEGREFTATLARIGERPRRDRQGLRRERRADRQERARAVGGRRPRAGGRALGAPAVDGHGGRREARRRASRAAVHDVDAHAGSQPQARVLHRAHDAGGAAAVPGRPHLVSPHRFDDAQREGARRIGGRDSRDVRRRVLLGAAPLRDQGEERAGSARSDSARRFRRDAGVARIGARSRRPPRLRADLEADDGVADGRRARAAHERGDLRRRHQRRNRRCSPRPARRSSSPVSAAPTSKAATIRRRSSKSRRPCCRSSTVGERVAREASARLHAVALEPKRHETSPPARYTEASLIKELERLGIGRPSTYAATIGTIERRGYVFRQGKALVPSFTAFAVTHLLRGHFGDLVDVAFTAEMEEDLDEISRGEREWLDFIRQFYRGDTQPSRARGRGQAGGSERRLPADRRRRRPRLERCRSACASAATDRSCSSARADPGKRRRCRRRSRRPICRSRRR